MSVLEFYMDKTRICMFTTASCPYCIKAHRLLLDKYNVSPQIIDLQQIASHRSHLAQALQRATGKSTVPAIFIFGRYIGGFTELDRLHDSGELTSILNAAPRYMCEFCGKGFATSGKTCGCFPRHFDDWGALI